MNPCKRIFIIGHPGAGKGLLGKSLAEKLGWEFIDADFGLEFNIGRTLKEIMGEQGETAFHRCESEIIASSLEKENIVVTTDGGVVCDQRNLQLLSSEFVIYLEVSTTVQIERMSRKQQPLLPMTNMQAFLDQLHTERDHLYNEAASLSINTEDNDIEKHLTQVLNTIEELQIAAEITLHRKDLIIFHKSSHIPVHLSTQQAICLKLLSQGKTSKEIAREINISYRTVEGYLSKIMELSGCSSGKELIALYHDQP